MANFKKFIPHLLVVEGGYQNFLTDKGNKNSLGEFVGTMRGISAPVYEAWIGRVPSIADMKAISKETAIAIYKANYWNKVKASLMKAQEVANVLVDHGVNAGLGNAGELVQNVLNDSFNKNLNVDGGIGNLTIAAMNSVDQVQLQFAIVDARIAYYESKRHLYPQFINGWLLRVQDFALEGERMLLEYGKPVVGFMTVIAVSTALFFLINKYNNQ